MSSQNGSVGLRHDEGTTMTDTMTMNEPETSRQTEPIVRLPFEPFYDRDGIELYHGDNCEVMSTMQRESVDLIVTSPPYDDLRVYGGFEWDFFGLVHQMKRVLKPGGVVVWVVSDQTFDGSETGSSFEQALHFKRSGFLLYDTMIWSKPSPAVPTESRYYDVFEFMFVFSKGKPKTLNLIEDRQNASAGRTATYEPRISAEQRYTNGTRTIKEMSRRWNVWNIGRADSEHPAAFPDELARDHIRSWSNEGDVVLDPFSGSGTTLAMAREMGRRGRGIEINEAYCQLAVSRLKQRLLFGGQDAANRRQDEGARTAVI